MADGNVAPGAGAPGQERKKGKQGWKTALPIVIIAVAIVFGALFITVLLVPEFKTIGDLFGFFGSQPGRGAA